MTRSGSRELLWSVVGCAALGLGVVFVAGRTWAAHTVTSGTSTRVHVAVTGADCVTALPALGWVAAALALAVLVTRGWGRRLVGVAVVFDGFLIVATAGTTHATGAALHDALVARSISPPSLSSPVFCAWAVVELALGLAVTGVGYRVAARGAGWPGLGSRYDAPPTAADPARSSWEALDRGEDPTV
jgi:hypothetical protein